MGFFLQGVVWISLATVVEIPPAVGLTDIMMLSF